MPTPRPGPNHRERLLQAATTEFAARGLAGARVDRIARTAKANKQLIYHYFGTKPQLFEAVLREMITSAHRAQARDRGASILRHLIVGVTRPRPAARRWQRILAWEALETGRRKTVMEDERRESFQGYVARVRELQAAGEVDPGLDAELLVLVFATMSGISTLQPQMARFCTGLSPTDPEFVQRFEAFSDRLLALLRPLDAQPSAAGRGREASSST